MQGLVTDSVLASLADELWHILDLASCTAVSDAGLHGLLPVLPHLQALDLSGCQISASCLREVGRLCPHIQLLRLGEILLSLQVSSSNCCTADHQCKIWRVNWNQRCNFLNR